MDEGVGLIFEMRPRPGFGRTDAEGRFVIAGLKDEDYRLTISDPAVTHGFESMDVAPVRPAKEARDYTVPADRMATCYLDARIVDPEGKPIAGVEFVFGLEGAGRGTILHTEEGTGAIHAGPVPPGRYAVYVEAPGYAPLDVPDVPLVAGRRHDLGELRVQPACSLEVTVLSADGSPAAEGTVVLVRLGFSASDGLRPQPRRPLFIQRSLTYATVAPCANF